ncbi:MAG: alpha/beta hydrolase [Acidimicrobiia bacterium]
MSVPLDRALPKGARIDLALARASRAKSDQRIGSLLVNPGGPGASGLDIVGYIASELPTSITDRFDVVAWDPRGSGKSAPVNCGNELDGRFAVDTAPDDPGELAVLEAAAKQFVDGCVKRTGDRLRHISTADTVADLDDLRIALGDDRLTYLGLSYGTYIGGLYATTYPTRVRALVLDGALDPTLSAEDVSVQQAKGFDDSLTEFFGWCRDRSSCAFHGRGDPARAYDALARRIDARPIGDGSGRFGPTQLDIAVAALLYGGESGYRELAAGLHDLEGGSAATLADVSDQYLGRTDDGHYNDEWAAFIAISCADGPNLTLAAAEALQRRAAIEAPHFGAGNVGLGYECSFWPYPPARTGPVTFSAPTAPPIVVVGTRGDPATPIAWARSLSTQLGNGRLVTVDDTTHTASLNGNACLDAILVRYLVDLQPPEDGTSCGRG